MNSGIGTILILGSVFLFLLILEKRFQLREPKRPFFRRFFVNVCLTAVALIVASIFVKPVATSIASKNTFQSFGLLAALHIPFYGHAVIGFLLMDVTFIGGTGRITGLKYSGDFTMYTMLILISMFLHRSGFTWAKLCIHQCSGRFRLGSPASLWGFISSMNSFLPAQPCFITVT